MGLGSGQGILALAANTAASRQGEYIDASGALGGLSAGKLTTLNARGAGTGTGQGAGAVSINTGGEVMGNYVDTSGVTHGCLWNP